MLSLQQDDPYLGFTIFFSFTVIVGSLICVILPLVMWISHKRQYAHYNYCDHLRELEIAQGDLKQEEESSGGNNSINASLSHSEGSAGGTGDASAVAAAAGTFHAVSTSRRSSRRARRRRQRQDSTLRQHIAQQQQRYYYYYANFWTRQLQPDQAMRQLLAFWYFCGFILLLGLCLNCAFLKTRAEQQAAVAEMGDYHGKMKVNNVTVLREESVQRYRWYFYRVFEAKVQLEVTWECDHMGSPSWTCDHVQVLYDPCQVGHSCHRYLGELQEEDWLKEEMTNENTNVTAASPPNGMGFCQEDAKQETTRESQQCIDDVLVGEKNNSTITTITLFGDCETCTAYAAIPDTVPQFSNRLLFNGIFFTVMGCLAMIFWHGTNRRYRTKFFPQPPGFDKDEHHHHHEDDGNHNPHNEQRLPLWLQRLYSCGERPPSSSNNNPVLNRLHNDQARQQQQQQQRHDTTHSRGVGAAIRHHHRRLNREPAIMTIDAAAAVDDERRNHDGSTSARSFLPILVTAAAAVRNDEDDGTEAGSTAE
jgi:hypothetical protein